MNPLLDQLLVGLIVAAAIGWFVWRSLRKRAGGKSCGGGCGCETKKPLG
jgi:FeoB-associated Cys-rich membrane protein